MIIKTGKDMAAACKKAATEYKTLYVAGCFGAPMTESNKSKYYKHHEYNRRNDRRAKIQAAAEDTFGFDCVCLIKGLLWGWDGDTAQTYGGAAYKSNNVPDITADAMIGVCEAVSDEFSAMSIGELLWMEGHCGIYIGNGLAVECTPIWEDGVQITAVGNMGQKEGYNTRVWTKHGKLPYVVYEEETAYSLPWLVPGEEHRLLLVMKLLLLACGYPCSVSGNWDAPTARALADFQQDYEISEHGCGPETWDALLVKE